MTGDSQSTLHNLLRGACRPPGRPPQAGRPGTRKGKLFVLTAVVCAIALMLVLPTGCGGTSTRGPVVSSVSPSEGTPGTELTVTGEAFGETGDNSTIQFRTTQATVTATVEDWSDTGIKTKST